jgi:hypothetical protein
MSYLQINSRVETISHMRSISSCVSFLSLCTYVVYNTAYVKKISMSSNWRITFKIAVMPKRTVI